MQASVVIPAGAQGPAFLTYDNFRVTRVYNTPIFYALTVGHLADRFSGGPAIQRMPENEQAMSIEQVRELQELLNGLGFDSGEPDGRVGSRTRSAIRAYQEQQGSTDGQLSITISIGIPAQLIFLTTAYFNDARQEWCCYWKLCNATVDNSLANNYEY